MMDAETIGRILTHSELARNIRNPERRIDYAVAIAEVADLIEQRHVNARWQRQVNTILRRGQ